MAESTSAATAGAASGSGEDMAQQLYDWAVNRMHFSTPPGVPMPTVEDFRFVCRGPMNDIWRQVIARMYPIETVRKIKGNLMLKRMSEFKGNVSEGSETLDAAAKESREKRLDLLNKIKTEMASVQLLEKDIERLRKEIATAEATYQGKLNQLQDINRKCALLKAYSKSTNEEIERIEELTSRVRQCAEKVQDRQKKASEPEVMLSRTVQTTDGVAAGTCLETACAKSVREACETIASFLHRLLQGSFEGKESEMTLGKEELWRHVESVVSRHSAQNILSALCEYADSTSTSLKERTDAIDINKEIEQLRFKFENGRLTDISTAPKDFRSVHQILESQQAEMFQKFIDTEKLENNSLKLQKRYAEASAAVDKALRQQYTDPEVLKLARTVVETGTKLASTRAAVNALTTISNELAAKIKQAKADKELLHAKHQKIQDFKKIAESKQNLIRVLVKQNMSASTKLAAQKTEIAEYIQRSLKGKDTELEKLAGQLKDFPSVEAGAFVRLQLPLIPVVTLDGVRKVAMADLSINKLSVNTPFVNCQQMMSKLYSSLNIPPYIAAESLLPKIAELQTQNDKMALVLKVHKTTDNSRDVDAVVHQLHKLCEAANQRDKEQADKLLPVLQQRLTQATQTLSDCLEVKDIATYWWEQPAQFCTPWVTVDGQNLQQWTDKFTVIATRMRQLPENAPQGH